MRDEVRPNYEVGGEMIVDVRLYLKLKPFRQATGTEENVRKSIRHNVTEYVEALMQHLCSEEETPNGDGPGCRIVLNDAQIQDTYMGAVRTNSTWEGVERE